MKSSLTKIISTTSIKHVECLAAQICDDWKNNCLRVTNNYLLPLPNEKLSIQIGMKLKPFSDIGEIEASFVPKSAIILSLPMQSIKRQSDHWKTANFYLTGVILHEITHFAQFSADEISYNEAVEKTKCPNGSTINLDSATPSICLKKYYNIKEELEAHAFQLTYECARFDVPIRNWGKTKTGQRILRRIPFSNGNPCYFFNRAFFGIKLLFQMCSFYYAYLRN